MVLKSYAKENRKSAQRLSHYYSNPTNSTSWMNNTYSNSPSGSSSTQSMKKLIVATLASVSVALVFFMLAEDNLMGYISPSMSAGDSIDGSIDGIGHRRLPCVSGSLKSRLGRRHKHRILCEVETSLPDAPITTTSKSVVESEDESVDENGDVKVDENKAKVTAEVEVENEDPYAPDITPGASTAEGDEEGEEPEPEPEPEEEEEKEEEEEEVEEQEEEETEELQEALEEEQAILKEELDNSETLVNADEPEEEPEPEPQPKSLADAFPVDTSTDHTAHTADNDTEQPSDDNMVAFVVTVPSCPEDDANPTATDDPGSAFYDAAAILKESICDNTAMNPNSGSKYNSTPYAIVHPDAVVCNDVNGNPFDRVALLEELGYWVLIYGDPIAAASVSDEKVTASSTGMHDLLRLYTYNVTSATVAVMVRFDTIFTEIVDTVIDELISSEKTVVTSTKSDQTTINTGMMFVKTSTTEFERLTYEYITDDFDPNAGGWGGSSGIMESGTEGFLTYFYSQNQELITMKSPMPGVLSYETTEECGMPWTCSYEEDWVLDTVNVCTELHSSWFTYRKQFESHWSKHDLIDTETNSDYHTEAFLGYCSNNTAGGYPAASDYQAWSEPTSQTTPIPTVAAITAAPTSTPTIAATAVRSATPTIAATVALTPIPTVAVTVAPTPIPTVAATVEATFNAASFEDDMLTAHNTRRLDLYNRFPQYDLTENAELKWANSIAESATGYANKLIARDGCSIMHGYDGDDYGGENLAATMAPFPIGHRSPENILSRWYNDEINLDTMELVGQKYHASQVAFRSSKYLGCGYADKLDSVTGIYCYIQVCRYIKAGNCFMEEYFERYPHVIGFAGIPAGCDVAYPGNEWLCSALGSKPASLCQPNIDTCPVPEGCF